MFLSLLELLNTTPLLDGPGSYTVYLLEYKIYHNFHLLRKHHSLYLVLSIHITTTSTSAFTQVIATDIKLLALTCKMILIFQKLQEALASDIFNYL